MTVRCFPSVRGRISFIWKSIEDVSDGYQAVSDGLCENFRLNQKRRCGVHAVIVGITSCTGRCIVTIIGDIPIFSKEWVSDKKFSQTILEKPIASGPYIIDDYEFGKNILYKRNPKYWAVNKPTRIGMYNFDFILFNLNL